MATLGEVPVRFIVIAITISGFLLSACSSANNNVWVKPGATQTEFAKDRYACLQDSQQRVGSAYVNQYGGSSNNSVITNGGLFDACMNARGWSLQDKVQFAAVKNDLDALNAEGRQICQRDDLRAHYSKTACDAKETTLEQMADKSKISPAEKEAYLKARSEQAAILKRRIEYVRQHDQAHGNSFAVALEHNQSEIDRAALDLIEGRVTRGEYNRRRHDIVEHTEEQMQQIARAN
jgi:hypothetical protein